MVRWLRWHCPPDTGFEIRALAVWGRARYLSVTEAPHNTNFHTWMGKKQFCFFQTAETGNRTPDSGVKGSGANHYPRAPALYRKRVRQTRLWVNTIMLPEVIAKPSQSQLSPQHNNIILLSRWIGGTEWSAIIILLASSEVDISLINTVVRGQVKYPELTLWSK